MHELLGNHHHHRNKDDYVGFSCSASLLDQKQRLSRRPGMYILEKVGQCSENTFERSGVNRDNETQNIENTDGLVFHAQLDFFFCFSCGSSSSFFSTSLYNLKVSTVYDPHPEKISPSDENRKK